MPKEFQKIGLFAKHNDKNVADVFEKLIHFLKKRGHDLVIDVESATLLPKTPKSPFPLIDREELAKGCDLVIVVGGDGSLLNAARSTVGYQVPILGINRGRLGFLADILPEQMEVELTAILDGAFIEEKRFLLEASIKRNGKSIAMGIALNDVILHSGSFVRMIDFEVYINDRFVLQQEADGIITATPTGSTAYALSANGPILYPTLNAMTLTPLCPHTLSSRPLVIDDQSQVRLLLSPKKGTPARLSCDGQLHFALEVGDEILIQKYNLELTLIHPKSHEYFSVLREKLGWHTHQNRN